MFLQNAYKWVCCKSSSWGSIYIAMIDSLRQQFYPRMRQAGRERKISGIFFSHVWEIPMSSTVVLQDCPSLYAQWLTLVRVFSDVSAAFLLIFWHLQVANMKKRQATKASEKTQIRRGRAKMIDPVSGQCGRGHVGCVGPLMMLLWGRAINVSHSVAGSSSAESENLH